MKLPLYIAGRYLFAKKSYNVINVISAISVAGMAIGTAALILILSVYNGFDRIIKSNLSDLNPDYKVISSSGKTFVAGPEFDELRSDSRVANWCNELEDHVFLTYGEPQQQAIARAKGVEFGNLEACKLGEHVSEGQFGLYLGEIPLASLGSSLAYSLKAHPRFLAMLDIWYPEREGQISLVNPMTSVNMESVKPGSIFSVNSDIDGELMIVPIETMQSLMDTQDELTAVGFWLADGCKGDFIGEALGPEYIVQDRYMQNPSLFKMMKYEKAAVFLILFFVVIIVALNIFGSMSMLIIEKDGDIATLKSLGAGDRLIRRIFVIEGWLISLLGMAMGTVAGIALALLQQYLGLVKMPGSYLVDAYPVVLQAPDVLITCAGTALIGLVVALAASSNLKK